MKDGGSAITVPDSRSPLPAPPLTLYLKRSTFSNTGPSFNGRTPVFGSGNGGSTPPGPTRRISGLARTAVKNGQCQHCPSLQRELPFALSRLIL